MWLLRQLQLQNIAQSACGRSQESRGDTFELSTSVQGQRTESEGEPRATSAAKAPDLRCEQTCHWYFCEQDACLWKYSMQHHVELAHGGLGYLTESDQKAQELKTHFTVSVAAAMPMPSQTSVVGAVYTRQRDDFLSCRDSVYTYMGVRCLAATSYCLGAPNCWAKARMKSDVGF